MTEDERKTIQNEMVKDPTLVAEVNKTLTNITDTLNQRRVSALAGIIAMNMMTYKMVERDLGKLNECACANCVSNTVHALVEQVIEVIEGNAVKVGVRNSGFPTNDNKKHKGSVH